MKYFLPVLIALYSGSASAYIAVTPTFNFYTNRAHVADAWGRLSDRAATYDNLTGKYLGSGRVVVGNRALTIPVKYALTPTAANIIKTAIRTHPALIVGTAAYLWLQDNRISNPTGDPTKWLQTRDLTQLQINASYLPLNYIGTISSAAKLQVNAIRVMNGCPSDNTGGWCPTALNYSYYGVEPDGRLQYRTYDYLGGMLQLFTRSIPGGSQDYPFEESDWDRMPDVPKEVHDELAKSPAYMPEGAPVGDPEIQAQDLPDGSPVQLPDGSTVQPMVRLTPNPDGTVRVDTYEKPLTDTAGVPIPSESATPVPTTTPTPGLCALYPDIIACQTFGTPDPEKPVATDKTLGQFTPGTLSEAGTCPAPISLNIAGVNALMSWDPVCNVASTYIRPLVLLMASVAAYFIFVGGLRGG